MKEILLTEKEMVFLVLFYFHGFNVTITLLRNLATTSLQH